MRYRVYVVGKLENGHPIQTFGNDTWPVLMWVIEMKKKYPENATVMVEVVENELVRV